MEISKELSGYLEEAIQNHKDLEIEVGASFDEIKKQYRRLAMKYHPDRNGDEEKFKKIKTAYEGIELIKKHLNLVYIYYKNKVKFIIEECCNDDIDQEENITPQLSYDIKDCHNQEEQINENEEFLITEEEMEIILQNIEQENYLAYDMLKDFVLLHPDGISEKLYADVDPEDLNNVLNLLQSYGLINRNIEKKFFTIKEDYQKIIRKLIDV